MAKKRRDWSFENAEKQAREGLDNAWSFTKQLERWRNYVAGEDAPQIIAGSLSLTLARVRHYEAIALARNKPEEAWPRVHLVWRYLALDHWVHVERAAQLAAMYPERAKTGKLPIGYITFHRFNSMMMAMAFAATLGEDKAAECIGDRCLKFITNKVPFVQPNAWTTGSVEQFLIRLYCAWRGIEFRFEDFGITNLGPYHRVFECWEDEADLTTAVLELCRIHAAKVVNYDLPNDDLIIGLQSGIYCELPVEILLLQRVRRDLRQPIPNPDHPLLRSPLTRIPFPCPQSGYDEHVAEVYGECKRLMPQLVVPWEEQILGSSSGATNKTRNGTR
jgi:hypothetical protein